MTPSSGQHRCSHSGSASIHSCLVLNIGIHLFANNPDILENFGIGDVSASRPKDVSLGVLTSGIVLVSNIFSKSAIR